VRYGTGKMGKIEVDNGYQIIIIVADDQAQALQDSKQYRDLQRVFERYTFIQRIEMDIIGGWPQVTVWDTDTLRLVAQLDIAIPAINFSPTTEARFWPAGLVLGVMQGVAQMLLAYDVTEVEFIR
jgi:hypothetical protein